MIAYDMRRALVVEKAILANLAPSVGIEHPAYQSSVERIAAIERALKPDKDAEPDE